MPRDVGRAPYVAPSARGSEQLLEVFKWAFETGLLSGMDRAAAMLTEERAQQRVRREVAVGKLRRRLSRARSH